MTMTHILHHAHCPDGHGSAYVAQKFLPGARIIPVSYGDPIPDSVDGEVVFVLDFCFPPDQLRELVGRAGAVRILDHHHTAVGYLSEVEDIIDVYTDLDDMPAVLSDAWAVIDQTHSGVGLAQRWFGFDRKWLNNIEDRDLWRFHLEHTSDIFAAVTSRPYTIEAWDEIDATPYGELVAEGRAINRYRDQLIESAVKDSWVVDIPGIGPTPVTPCPYSVGSDVAGELAKNHPGGIGAYFMVKQDTVRFGLRARNGGPNVADLAKELFGGGGHPGASGFEVSREEFNSWH
jgi:hypothetical protein